ncbi:MAG: mitomycin resistance protein [Planctomycetes bacterium]|nr:mitomycin resistance protein [Planctomycetota bacterium]
MGGRRIKKIRRLEELAGVGPATMQDFSRLGVRSVAQLARRSPRRMYDRLCELTGARQDPCVLDVFEATVAQARNPRLPRDQREWWYWSKKRKARAKNG